MINQPFQLHFKQCCNPDCKFRYPVTEERQDDSHCPKCGNVVKIASIVNKGNPQPNYCLHPQKSVILILDNLRSVFNAGSIFRTSDGAGIVQKIILGGTTPTPDHPKFSKTALGSEKTMVWEYAPNTLDVVLQYKSQGIKIISLEYLETSQNIFQVPSSFFTESIFCLIVGNEVTGVDPDILSITDTILHIPMHGIKESLNVAIAASIAIYTFYPMFE